MKRSIQCYCDQTYAHRELVIITNQSAETVAEIMKCITSFNRDDIRFESLTDRKYTLGELRNHSLQKATGSIVCMWDDDDLFHPDRLAAQYTSMTSSQAEASILSSYLHFFWTDLKLGWSDWQSHFPPPMNGLPGSLMMVKSVAARYPEDGNYANAGEDTFLLYRLYKGGVKIANLSSRAYLYLYSFHGTNTWAKAHHEGLFKLFHRKNETLSKKQQELLTDALAYFQLPEGYRLQ